MSRVDFVQFCDCESPRKCALSADENINFLGRLRYGGDRTRGALSPPVIPLFAANLTPRLTLADYRIGAVHFIGHITHTHAEKCVRRNLYRDTTFRRKFRVRAKVKFTSNFTSTRCINITIANSDETGSALRLEGARWKMWETCRFRPYATDDCITVRGRQHARATRKYNCATR